MIRKGHHTTRTVMGASAAVAAMFICIYRLLADDICDVIAMFFGKRYSSHMYLGYTIFKVVKQINFMYFLSTI